jgi:hypothetical protein
MRLNDHYHTIYELFGEGTDEVALRKLLDHVTKNYGDAAAARIEQALGGEKLLKDRILIAAFENLIDPFNQYSRPLDP